MKNISIVTFYNAHNYGAVLQTFALKKVLSTYSTNVFVKRISVEKFKQMYNVKLFKGKSLRSILGNFIRYPLSKQKFMKFDRFINQFLLDTDYIEDSETVYIAGSDQVWNYGCTNFDKTFFLDFVKDKKHKNSYSASFGFDEIPAEYVDEYHRLLKAFNHISVREKQGADIIKNLLGRDVEVTLDPTLLMNQQDWQKSFDVNIKHTNYILVYAFGITDRMAEFVNTLSADLGNMPVVMLMYSKFFLNKIHRAEYVGTASPEEWVQYFFNASYVVTNSFHGTAFSINFNKRFFVEFLPPPAKVNSRLENILNLFDLKDRLIINGKCNALNKDIDYQKVNAILDKERGKSIKYLESIINDSDEQN